MCISPLTSLMMDQHAKYTPRGLITEFVGEAQSDEAAIDRAIKGKVQIVYMSPESAVSNDTYRGMFLSQPYKDRLVAVAIDEAHCVKTWGDEFRVAFAEIGELRSFFPSNVRIIALTATATVQILKSVTLRLSLVDPVIVSMSPHREYLL